MKKIQLAGATLLMLSMMGCNTQKSTMYNDDKVHLITVDPGHFHAALVQKSMYDNVDDVVPVYAPEGADVKMHLARIEGYNNRQDSPTRWKEEVYTGADFFDKMIADKKGNVVVLSGNNGKKTEYILRSLEAGLNVLADKPMAINSADFELLKKAFEIANEKDLLLYDIMTERFEITTVLQRELSMLPEIFGQLEKGTPDNPAVTKESVHHFNKVVSGSVLTRPAWFMDVAQQGEGIVDVTTHLVDLVQWESFPQQPVNYKTDIQIGAVRRWTTDMTLSQFKAITNLDAFPDYLKNDVVNDTVLKVYSNGEINYTLKEVHAKVSVIWNYKAPDGAGDTHYSVMRGSKSALIIKQGAEQAYKPTLYIEQKNTDAAFEEALTKGFKKVEAKYPGILLKKISNGWEVEVPQHYHDGHEAHFGRVTAQFLQYLKEGKMPDWEVPNMLAKYYTTTQALEKAKKETE